MVEILRDLAEIFSNLCKAGKQSGELDFRVGKLSILDSMIRFYPKDKEKE